jgi:hypothetical protein
LARSSAGRRRPGAGAAPAPVSPVAPSGVGLAPTPTLAHATLPRVWAGVGYRPLPDPAAARPLFDFAALSWPAAARPALAWGAFIGPSAGERLIGALVAERHERALLVHGPVVREGDDPVEIAGQLVAAAIDHAAALGADTLYARPQGLDRVWVRFGFIPVPESTLPAALAGRPGAGLFAWRGGSALWTLRDAARA